MNPDNSNIELVLRDIHLPDSHLWWPPAPGWWLLLFVLVLIGLSYFFYKKTWYARKLKKSIKLELEKYYEDYNKKGNSQILVQQLSAFLRRVSLYQFQNKSEMELSLAKLQGIEWLEFLDSKLPPNKSKQLSFKGGVGKIFLSGPYQAVIDEDVTCVYELVEYWLSYNLKNKYGFM